MDGFLKSQTACLPVGDCHKQTGWTETENADVFEIMPIKRIIRDMEFIFSQKKKETIKEVIGGRCLGEF